jgi:hypothetical protein
MKWNKLADQKPIEWKKYLISDGNKIDVSLWNYSFMNYTHGNGHQLLNDDIKYWAELSEIELPNED